MLLDVARPRQPTTIERYPVLFNGLAACAFKYIVDSLDTFDVQFFICLLFSFLTFFFATPLVLLFSMVYSVQRMDSNKISIN